MAVLIVEPGPLTTIQDAGRPGWGWCGVPPSGAFDDVALRAANALVGNPPESAGLEATLMGPTLEFDAPALVAVTGAAATRPTGNPVEPRRSFPVNAGERIRIGAATSARAYVAVRGGIDVPPVLGSRSTCVAAMLGGLHGGPLRAGDVAPVGSAGTGEMSPRSLDESILEVPGREIVLRVVAGVHADSFTESERRRFLEEAFVVSPDADRVGVRFRGTRVARASDADVEPEGMVTGDVQVPPDGFPIVMGPDHPATGGYAKIATVIAADVRLVAQARPGMVVRFAPVSIAEARRAYAARESAIRKALG